MSLPIVRKAFIGITLAIAGAGSYPFAVPAAQAVGLTNQFGLPAHGINGERRADMPTSRQMMSTLPDIAAVAAVVTPAVVHISVSGSKKVSIGSDASCEDGDEVDAGQDVAVLKRRLRQFQKQFGIVAPVLTVPVQTDGSGVIVRSDGIIITNAHIVEEAESISVTLSNRREYPAKLMGMDALTDIAVLKIDAKDLAVATLSQVAPRGPGDWVVAIGSPFGLTHSVTAGIVSATGRFFSGEALVPFIQSDVAVSPGSSGGPLVNMRGEVIGIISSVMARTDSAKGISFSIPIDLAWMITQGILRDGRVRHPRLGVTVQDLSDPLAKSFQLTNPSGAVVTDVADDSPAGRAGLKVGDVILSIDEKMIEVPSEIAVNLIMANPGQTMNLGVWHRGAMRKIRLLLDETAEKPEGEGIRLSTPPQEIIGFGLVISAVDPNDQVGLTRNSGVLVRSVTGAAQHAGVRVGDVLLALNATAINNPDEAIKIAARTSGYLAALIQHGRERRYVPLLRENRPLKHALPLR
jgi:serine protease Do